MDGVEGGGTTYVSKAGKNKMRTNNRTVCITVTVSIVQVSALETKTFFNV